MSDDATVHLFDVSDTDVVGGIGLYVGDTETDAREKIAWDPDDDLFGDDAGTDADDARYLGKLTEETITEAESILQSGATTGVALTEAAAPHLPEEYAERLQDANNEGIRRQEAAKNDDKFSLGFPLQFSVEVNAAGTFHVDLTSGDLQELRNAGHEDVLEEMEADVRDGDGKRYEVLLEADGSYQIGREVEPYVE